MSKIVTIVGATGIQGGSVVDALIQDKAYSIRAVTRNTNSDAAQALARRGVEVVEADANSVQSLQNAFEGSHAIFAATNFFEPFAEHGPEEAGRLETAQGINMAKAAAETPTLEHYVWSTLPNSEKKSGGKVIVDHYAAKNRVDDYIRSDAAGGLLAKTTFLYVGSYTSNLAYPFWKPTPIPQSAALAGGQQVYLQVMSSLPTVTMPMAGDARRNVGLFVAATLRQPALTRQGRTVSVVTEAMTAGTLLQTWARATGKVAEYAVVAPEAYERMWPRWGALMHKNYEFFRLAGAEAFTEVADDGQKIISGQDLGVEGVVGVTESLGQMVGLFD